MLPFFVVVGREVPLRGGGRERREFLLERGEMGVGRLQSGGEGGIINRFENGRKVSVWNRIGFCWIWR